MDLRMLASDGGAGEAAVPGESAWACEGINGRVVGLQIAALPASVGGGERSAVRPCVVAGCGEGGVYIWDMDTGQCVRVHYRAGTPVQCVRASPSPAVRQSVLVGYDEDSRVYEFPST